MATKKQEAKKPEVKKAAAPKAATTAVAKVEAAPPAEVMEQGSGAWGAEEVSNSDIMISKLLLAQGLSKVVEAGKAVAGQIYNSMSGEVLGGIEKAGSAEKKTIELIPLYLFRTLVTSVKKKGEKKFKFEKQEPLTPQLEALPGDETLKDGTEIQRDKVINVYVLRPEDVAEGVAFPFMLSFRRTSYTAGKKISTQGAEMRSFNQPLAKKTIELTVDYREKDDNKWWAFDVLTKVRTTEANELAEARKWYDIVKKGDVKVDHSDIEKEEAPEATNEGADESNDY